MAPPVDPDKIKSMMKNPYAAEMIEKDIELLKLKKRRKEEAEWVMVSCLGKVDVDTRKYEKVGQMLHTILGALLCAVDMRLGVAAFVFFLYRHFALAHAKELDDQGDEIEAEKKDLMKRLSEAKKQGADKQEIASMQQQLSRM